MIELHVYNCFTYLRKPESSSIPAFISAQNILAKNNVLAPKVDGAWFSQAYKMGKWDGRKHFIDRQGKFPSGLLSRFLEATEALQMSVHVIDKRVKPFNDSDLGEAIAHGIDLRDYQKQAIDICLEKARGTIGAATNAGKTEIAAALFNAIPGNCLMITHRIELLSQTVDRLRERTEDRVGYIGGGEDVESNARVVVAMIQTLASKLKSDKDSIRSWLSRFCCVIVDEAHRSSSKSYHDILSQCDNAYYRIGLTGTPGSKGDIASMEEESFTGPVIFSIRNNALIDMGVSSKPLVVFVNMPTVKHSYDSYDEAYSSMIVHNTLRNNKIVSLAMREVADGRQVLIMVNLILHGETIQLAFDGHLDDVPFIHGSSEVEFRKDCLRSFADGEMPVLIASTIVKEGISIPTIGALIYAVGGKSKVSLLQSLGRSLRKNKYDNSVHYYDFIDYGDRHMQEQSLKRLEMLANEGLDIQLEDYTIEDDKNKAIDSKELKG